MTQLLPDGTKVYSLKVNEDKTVIVNGTDKMTVKEFHSKGGIIALFHEHAHDRGGKPFRLYRQ